MHTPAAEQTEAGDCGNKEPSISTAGEVLKKNKLKYSKSLPVLFFFIL